MAEDGGLTIRHRCEPTERWVLYDARGISCGYVCEKCEAEKRLRYRVDIFSNPNYDHDEPLDED